MREIKFKGKRIDNGEWVYGYYVSTFRGGEKHFIYSEPSMVMSNVFDIFEVIPETVGQFTGLEDKNGKEIYDGDIYTIGLIKIGVIKYSTYLAAFVIDFSNESEAELTWAFLDLGDKNSKTYGEIIGNIHET